ncbi:MAG TPA: histidine phosphatase family protein [Candidatus Woesebacteria bacterium]|nr:histidine phosphatase family protein [Candidatus Woesebacteria bacterium]
MSNNYCTFYIVRHGETEWNVKKLLQGHSDSLLTKNGKQQATNLALQLKDIQFDAIYSSDLLRTQKTAEILRLERKLVINTTKILRERYFGRYEGKTFAEFSELQKEYFKKYEQLTDHEKAKFKYPETESDEEIISRLILFLREITVAYSNKKILIVSHGGVMKALLRHLGFGTYDELATVVVSNASYFILESDGVDFVIKETHEITKV